MIPKGRRSDKKSETTDGEKRQLRAVWGSVNRVQRETRQDVSLLASLGKGSLNQSTVQDLCDANVAVDRLKPEPFLGIKLPHVPVHKLRWATLHPGLTLPRITVKEPFLVGAISPGTLAAETQIMSEALAEVEWSRGLFEELTNPILVLLSGQPDLGIAVSWWPHVRQTLR